MHHPVTPRLDLPVERDRPLAMDAETFRAAGHALVDRIAAFLESVPRRPVTTGERPEALRALLGGDADLPEEGADPQALLAAAADLVMEHSLLNAHPRFLGYITGSPAPIGMLGEMLAAAVNPNTGAWILSPMATEIESQAVRWVASLIGYPAGCGGLFVSGGNMANFVGFLAARSAMDRRDAGRVGLAGGPPLRVYASAETHTWIQKATDLFGLGTDSIRWIPTDEALRMDVAALRRALERDRDAGDQPMMVVGTAGTVSTGAVDPLFDLADVCREHGVWFHVDGAYGGFAAAAEDVPEELRGLSRADSVAVDPHKWLYAPLEAGCVLVRDPQALRNAFTHTPPYYHFGNELNYFEYGLQNSRGFRALKVWLMLRQVGRRGYAGMIGDDIRLSRHLFARVDAHPELEALTQSLSITTFRYVPPELAGDEDALNALNQRLLDRIQASGEAFVSNAVIGGRYALRACIVNFNTTRADVEALPEIVVRLGREVHGAR